MELNSVIRVNQYVSVSQSTEYEIFNRGTPDLNIHNVDATVLLEPGSVVGSIRIFCIRKYSKPIY